MVTTNLFSHPIFKDGAFTGNDRDVRRFALRKVLRNLDLAAELGAETFVMWGGREGSEFDGAKDVKAALDRYAEGRRPARRRTSPSRATTCASPSSRSRTSRAATSCCPRSGTPSPSSPALEHPDMVGVNPEVGHEQMAGLNFTAGIAQALWRRQALPHRPQRPARLEVRPGPGVRPRRPAQRLRPVDLLENGFPGGGPAYDGPRHFDYKPTRTEDFDGRLGVRRGQHAHLPAAQGARGGLPRRPRGAGRAGRRGVDELADPTLRGRDAADLLADRSAFEDFDADAKGKAAATASCVCDQLGDRAPARRPLSRR